MTRATKQHHGHSHKHHHGHKHHEAKDEDKDADAGAQHMADDQAPIAGLVVSYATEGGDDDFTRLVTVNKGAAKGVSPGMIGLLTLGDSGFSVQCSVRSVTQRESICELLDGVPPKFLKYWGHTAEGRVVFGAAEF